MLCGNKTSGRKLVFEHLFAFAHIPDFTGV